MEPQAHQGCKRGVVIVTSKGLLCRFSETMDMVYLL